MASTGGMSQDYDDHSEFQRRVADTGSALVNVAIAGIDLPDPAESVVLMDLGAGTGRNSLAVMGHAVRTLRKRSPEVAVVCVHNDLVSNDWSGLFANVASSPDSYFQAPGPPVLAMAAAGSFFEPTVPAGFADLQMSFSAAHWLREDPQVEVPEGFYFCEATGATRAALADQADADWRAFLGARAADLAPGGWLVVQCVGTHVDDEGTELVTARELLAAMSAVAHDMVADRLLDPSIVESYVLPVYARTAAEARVPLEEAGSPFEVIRLETAPVPNPYLEKRRHDGDDRAYARAYTAFVRAFAASALRRGLFIPASMGRGGDELVDDFFGRLERRFAERPDADAFRDWTLTVVAQRR